MSSMVGERARTGVGGPAAGARGGARTGETTVLVVADYQLSEELLVVALGSAPGIGKVAERSQGTAGRIKA